MRCLVFVLLLFPLAGFSKPVRYEISPLLRDGPMRLQVRVWFAGDADGETELAIPTQFGNADKLFRCIQNLACTTSGCRLRIDADTLFATLEHAPGQELQLSYEVIQDFTGQSVPEANAFRPVLQPGYFHILGNTLFIAPKWNEAYDVTLEWLGFPANWLLHNSFGSESATQHFTFQNLRWLESVFVGGDYRLHEADVQGKPVWLAIRGDDWGFADDSLFSMLQRTVALQRDFWDDFAMPYYTVTLTPLAQRPPVSSGQVLVSTRLAYLGTGLTNSFAAFATPHKSLGVEDLYHLFHHELMHHWIGCKIRSGGQPNDMQMAWFSEGFTEYFALKNMLKGGFVTPEQYMDRLNGRFFDGLYHSPKREASNRAIADSFFVNHDFERLPYLRGCVFAFFLDNGIKAGSNSRRALHDLMLDLLEYYQRSDRDLLSNFDFFLETSSDYLQKDVEPLYQTHIQEGKLIPADTYMLPPYLKMEVDEEGSPFFWLDKSVAGWEHGIRE
jgi:predicted metalloprotease with PDZ domain